MSESRVFYLGRHLLDHQIVGLHGDQIGKVDDLELTGPDGPGTPDVTGILTGQIAYGRRFGGRAGVWISTLAGRLRGAAGDEPRRFDVSLVKSVTHTVFLNVPAAELPAPDLEEWLGRHFIGRLPGSGG
jgi:hypothetical protein